MTITLMALRAAEEVNLALKGAGADLVLARWEVTSCLDLKKRDLEVLINEGTICYTCADHEAWTADNVEYLEISFEDAATPNFWVEFAAETERLRQQRIADRERAAEQARQADAEIRVRAEQQRIADAVALLKAAGVLPSTVEA